MKNPPKPQQDSDRQAFLDIETGEISYSDSGTDELAKVSDVETSPIATYIAVPQPAEVEQAVNCITVHPVIAHSPQTALVVQPAEVEQAETALPAPATVRSLEAIAVMPAVEPPMARAVAVMPAPVEVMHASVDHLVVRNNILLHPEVYISSGKPAVEFHSCFISYSHQDEEFVHRLCDRMRGENLKVWYADKEMEAGKKIIEQVTKAIRKHDKLLIVLSENSMKSEWVKTEILRAREIERKEQQRKLLPIRLVSLEVIKQWDFTDSNGEDLTATILGYYILDFSNFERAFEKLLSALRRDN